MNLGDRVTFSRVLRRHSEYPGAAASRRHMKVWRPTLTFKHQEGIVVGERTLSNGEVYWHGPDDGAEYRLKETLKAYLVAYDLRRKPVLVRPEDLEVGDE